MLFRTPSPSVIVQPSISPEPHSRASGLPPPAGMRSSLRPHSSIDDEARRTRTTSSTNNVHGAHQPSTLSEITRRMHRALLTRERAESERSTWTTAMARLHAQPQFSTEQRLATAESLYRRIATCDATIKTQVRDVEKLRQELETSLDDLDLATRRSIRTSIDKATTGKERTRLCTYTWNPKDRLSTLQVLGEQDAHYLLARLDQLEETEKLQRRVSELSKGYARLAGLLCLGGDTKDELRNCQARLEQLGTESTGPVPTPHRSSKAVKSVRFAGSNRDLNIIAAYLHKTASDPPVVEEYLKRASREV